MDYCVNEYATGNEYAGDYDYHMNKYGRQVVCFACLNIYKLFFYLGSFCFKN